MGNVAVVNHLTLDVVARSVSGCRFEMRSER